MRESSSMSDVSDEDLHVDFEEACNDVADLGNELRASKIEVQRLEVVLRTALRAQASPMRAAAASCLPAVVDPVDPSEERRVDELRAAIVWLAEHVDLDQTEALDVGFAVPVGGRTVLLQHVVQWPLPTAPGGRLRLSVPAQDEELFTKLLSSVQQQKAVGEEALRELADMWDVVPGELSVGANGEAEPSLLLARRGDVSGGGALVATWPSREAIEAFHLLQGGTTATAADSEEGSHGGDRVEVEEPEPVMVVRPPCIMMARHRRTRSSAL